MLVCLRSTFTPFFWENTSEYVVFSASWFNSGYMLLPVYVVVGTASVYSAMLVPQWYMLCVSHGVSCWLRCTSRCVPPWFSGPDALHHGWYGPEGQLRASAVAVRQGRRHPCRFADADSHGPPCLKDHNDFAVAVCAGWSMSQVCKSCWFLQFRSCSSSTWSSTPCRGAEFIPWSRQFVRPGFPQLLQMVVDVPVYRSCNSPCRSAEADSPGLAVQQTTETPQLRVDKVVDASICRSCKSSVPCLLSCTTDARGSDSADSVEVPQVQFLRGGGRRCSHAAMRSSCRS